MIQISTMKKEWGIGETLKYRDMMSIGVDAASLNPRE